MRKFLNSQVLEEIRFVFFTAGEAEMMQQYVKKAELRIGLNDDTEERSHDAA